MLICICYRINFISDLWLKLIFQGKCNHFMDLVNPDQEKTERITTCRWSLVWIETIRFLVIFTILPKEKYYKWTHISLINYDTLMVHQHDEHKSCATISAIMMKTRMIFEESCLFTRWKHCLYSWSLLL